MELKDQNGEIGKEVKFELEIESEVQGKWFQGNTNR